MSIALRQATYADLEAVPPHLVAELIDGSLVTHPRPETAYFETAPDWVCEVVSPSTEAYDRGPKRRIYARAGVAYFWLLDPRAEILETFILADGGWRLDGTFSGIEAVAAQPFDAVAFPLTDLWPFGRTAPTAPAAELSDDDHQ